MQLSSGYVLSLKWSLAHCVFGKKDEKQELIGEGWGQVSGETFLQLFPCRL